MNSVCENNLKAFLKNVSEWVDFCDELYSNFSKDS